MAPSLPGLPGFLRIQKDLRWKDQFVCYYEVEKGGMASLSDFYMFMFQWFIKEGMKNANGTTHPEEFYLHKIRGDGVQENLIWWRAYKPVGNLDRKNGWYAYHCKMDFQVFGKKPTEVMYNNKKIKTDKLGMVIRVWWWLQIDPYNRWEKSWLGRLWGGTFPKWFYEYLLNNDLEEHRDKARELAKRQENEIKAFFEMTTNMPMPRSWFPEEGYKWKKPGAKEEEFSDKARAPDWQI